MDDQNLKVKELMTFVPSGGDYQKEIRFYEALGFTVDWKSDELSILKVGNLRFFLQNFENKEMQNNFMMDLEVENLDQWWERIEGLHLNFPEQKQKRLKIIPGEKEKSI